MQVSLPQPDRRIQRGKAAKPDVQGGHQEPAVAAHDTAPSKMWMSGSGTADVSLTRLPFTPVAAQRKAGVTADSSTGSSPSQRISHLVMRCLSVAAVRSRPDSHPSLADAPETTPSVLPSRWVEASRRSRTASSASLRLTLYAIVLRGRLQARYSTARSPPAASAAAFRRSRCRGP